MTGYGRVRFSVLCAMLRACAPGYTTREGKHNIAVMFGGRTFPSLPCGEHGERDPEIDLGVVKKLIRFFGIDYDKAADHILQLPRKKKDNA